MSRTHRKEYIGQVSSITEEQECEKFWDKSCSVPIRYSYQMATANKAMAKVGSLQNGPSWNQRLSVVDNVTPRSSVKFIDEVNSDGDCFQQQVFPMNLNDRMKRFSCLNSKPLTEKSAEGDDVSMDGKEPSEERRGTEDSICYDSYMMPLGRDDTKIRVIVVEKRDILSTDFMNDPSSMSTRHSRAKSGDFKDETCCSETKTRIFSLVAAAILTSLFFFFFVGYILGSDLVSREYLRREGHITSTNQHTKIFGEYEHSMEELLKIEE